MHVSRTLYKHRIKRIAHGLSGLFLMAAIMLTAAPTAWAAPAYTPYANSLTAQAGTVSTPGNAVGAPDGQTANLTSSNASITLDMGEGEEGTHSLKVYLGQVTVQTNVTVEFLDASSGVISTEAETLFLNLQASTQSFFYDWHISGKPYRSVRLSTSSGLVLLRVDAVEALGFIGSSPTQDTDGDGVPDREDSTPLVPNSPTTNPGGGSGGGNNTNTTIARTAAPPRGAGPTTPVNTPPATMNDKDGDQMDDAWELAHGLNPNDKEDASKDPDQDQLINLNEYQFDTDPHKFDTDGDGMPDGWEVDNGLNARVDDANEDPDGDYLTNLGEYHFNTKPYRADNIQVVSASSFDNWYGLALGALLLIALIAILIASIVIAGPAPTKNDGGWYRLRHKLFRAFRSKSR
jgi:hypothetical protein